METKCTLLGKGLYTDIPDDLTIGNIPTLSGLDYASGEEFDKVLIDSVLPGTIVEKINFNNLLEIDFQWLCRAVRVANYGPYHTASTIWCDQCGKTSHGDYPVKLTTIGCKELPKNFTNDIIIKRDEFIDFSGDIKFRLPTVQQINNAYKDKAFQTADGRVNRELARICYMVYSIKGKTGNTPVEVKLIIEKEMSAADFIILKGIVADLGDYGLRAGGTCECPACKSQSAAFVGMSDDRFFRPSLSDLRYWKQDRLSEKQKPGVVTAK